MRYEGTIYRPPGEWKSYLLQATVGCSHNGCTFCGMYKDKSYRVRDLDEVLEDIELAYRYYDGYLTRVFLCDGDAISLPMDYLMTVLKRLYERFPMLEKVTTYAGPRSTMRKTPEQLRELCDAGLKRAYLGLESGDGELLLKRGKGVDAQQMLEAGLALKNAGFDLWVTALIGLGGPGEASERNALMTAEILNKLQPQHCSMMTYMPVKGTPLYREIEQGSFSVLSAVEAMQETRLLLQNIQTERMHFTSDHASNFVSLNGTLPDEQESFIAELTAAIEGSGNARVRRFRGL